MVDFIENDLSHNYTCPPEQFIAIGVRADDLPNKFYQPIIHGPIVISFDRQACKIAHANMMTDEQVAMATELASEETPALAKEYARGMTKKRMREISIEANPLHDKFQPLNRQAKQHVVDLLTGITCHANLSFVVKDWQAYQQHTAGFKIAMCSIEQTFLTSNYQKSAYSLFPFDDDLREESVIIFVFDDYNDIPFPELAKADRENTRAHEIMHSLGFDHPYYTSLAQQKIYYSVLDDVGTEGNPKAQQCLKKHGDKLKEALTCLAPSTTFTGMDYCALRGIYGASLNNSEVCQSHRSKTMAKFKYLTPIETDDGNNDDDAL